jgi:uncharacterized membrane protein
MQGKPRKIFQASFYEMTTIVIETVAFSALFNQPAKSSGLLSIAISILAIAWNILFNTIFERWEAKQRDHQRTLKRRIVHTLGFEGGLTIILVPTLAIWLKISLWEAFITDIALLIFFLFYSFVFQWLFEQVFDSPNSAKPRVR